jgi:hypothetical protein
MKEEQFNLAMADNYSDRAVSWLITVTLDRIRQLAVIDSQYSDSESRRERTQIDLVDEALVQNIGIEGVYFN